MSFTIIRSLHSLSFINNFEGKEFYFGFKRINVLRFFLKIMKVLLAPFDGLKSTLDIRWRITPRLHLHKYMFKGEDIQKFILYLKGNELLRVITSIWHYNFIYLVFLMHVVQVHLVDIYCNIVVWNISFSIKNKKSSFGMKIRSICMPSMLWIDNSLSKIHLQ